MAGDFLYFFIVNKSQLQSQTNNELTHHSYNILLPCAVKYTLMSPIVAPTRCMNIMVTLEPYLNKLKTKNDHILVSRKKFCVRQMPQSMCTNVVQFTELC